MAVDLLEPTAPMTISSEERAFFVSLGERIASLRRANNITQVQLAEALGVSQQTLQSYEVGRRRLPVSALPTVARTLSVSLDELFGTQAKAARGVSGKRGPAPQWQQQIEAVAQLPKSQQQFVARMIKTVLAEAGAR
jgi:transcriptional regulator with XRE-family HTH domain